MTRFRPPAPSDDFDDADGNREDPAAQRLRELLAAQAGTVRPSGDALTRIRLRTQQRARHDWRRFVQAGSAALATAGVVAVAVIVVAVVHTRGTNDATLPAGSSSPTPPTSSSAPTSSTSALAGQPSASYPVWLFYVGKLSTPNPVLYREQVTRPRPVANAFIGDAVRALLSTPPKDPDYANYWPAGTTLLGATISGDTTAVIDLSAQAADGPAGFGAISAQQLLYTIEGAAPKIDALELRIAGQPQSTLWGSQIGDPVAMQPAWQVDGHVWINSPTQGATVASTFTVSGEAIVDEGTVNWAILQNGGMLKNGFAQATAGAPEQGTWSTPPITLTPGSYVVQAWEVSAKDGSKTFVDEKSFTVG